MSETYVLGGKTFLSASIATVQHSFHTVGLIRRSGLYRLELKEGETAEDFGARIVLDVIESGQALRLLGCLLIPEGTDPLDWRPEMAQETAEFLGRLTDEKDHALVRSLLLQSLIAFFRSGLVSLWTSRTSSERGESRQNGNPAPMGSGPSSFGNSPATTSTLPGR